jgi:hypothetical protein
MDKVIILYKVSYVGCEGFTAVTMKDAVFWDVAPYGFIIYRHFGGTCRLHLQGRRNNASEEKQPCKHTRRHMSEDGILQGFLCSSELALC